MHRSHRTLLRALDAAEQRASPRADLPASPVHPPLGHAVPSLFADVPQLLDRLQAGKVAQAAGVVSEGEPGEAVSRDEAVQALVRKLDALSQWAAVTHDLSLCLDTTPSEQQQVDLNALFDRALLAAKARATRQGVEISSYRHPEILQAVTGDVRLWQAGMGHLLGIALDTTSRGTIQVKVQQADASLRVDVVDTGIGVSQATIDAWTAAWDQNKTWPEPADEGLVGQRLLLARALVRRAGGSFEARSVPGHGSRWTAQWSLASLAATASEPRSTPA
jgi:signal transduction histidine kinase